MVHRPSLLRSLFGLVFFFFCTTWGCVLPSAPLLTDLPCTTQSDCLYGQLCCEALGGQGQKVCMTTCIDCLAGQTRSCYDEAKRASMGKGVCQAGQQACGTGGKWEEQCKGAIYPSQEACDGKDNDCDGSIDEDLQGCECAPVGKKRDCFAADKALIGTGICKQGVQRCQAGFTWGVCEGEVPPEAEECDGKDNDCDGEIDEDLTRSCSGACGQGEIPCNNGAWGTCSAQPTAEECDGKDNDCDGSIDNAKGATTPLSRSCYTGSAGTQGKGPCKEGTQTCQGAAWSACVGEATPKPKDCSNNADNDCDGQIDADCSCPSTCQTDNDCKVAACGSNDTCLSGTCREACPRTCAFDSDCAAPGCGSRSRCINSTCTSLSCPTTCTKDTECQNTACGNKTFCVSGICAPACQRDSRLGQSCSSGRGICAGTGKWVCTSDQNSLYCDASEDLSKKQAKETCQNKLDDDCNGFVDEGCGSASGGWALTTKANPNDKATDVAVDKQGNIYIVGEFTGTTTIGLTTLRSTGATDFFVAKYDPQGNALWAKSTGSPQDDTASAITIDNLNNVYIAGTHGATAIIGPFPLRNKGFFVAKYSAGGQLQSVKSAEASTVSIYKLQDIAVDPQGNVFIAGDYDGKVDFGTSSLWAKSMLTCFIAKLDTTGKFAWGVNVGTDSVCRGLTTDSAGNLYATGAYSKTAALGTTLTSTGAADLFVTKVSPTGQFLWGVSGGGARFDGGTEIKLDSQGQIYIGGYFTQTSTFGQHTLTSKGADDAFVAKLDQNGKFLWATGGGGTMFDRPEAIDLDTKGNVFLTGQFKAAVTFGSFKLTPAAKGDAYVVKFDTSGNITWAASTQGTTEVIPKGIALDGLGNVFVTGYFAGSASFASTVLKAPGAESAFLWNIPKP